MKSRDSWPNLRAAATSRRRPPAANLFVGGVTAIVLVDARFLQVGPDRGFTSFPKAILQYQFVAEGTGGQILARSPVFGDVLLELCSR